MKINDVTDCMYVNNAKISFVPNYKFNIRLFDPIVVYLASNTSTPNKKNGVLRIGMSLHTNKTIVSRRTKNSVEKPHLQHAIKSQQ